MAVPLAFLYAQVRERKIAASRHAGRAAGRGRISPCLIMGAVMGQDEKNTNALEERKNKIYALLCDDLYVPMRQKEIAALLDLKGPEREELRGVLDALVAEGRAQVSKRGKYSKSSRRLLEGVFESNARGFGFVSVEGGDADIFISRDCRGGANQGDTVQVEITAEPEGRRREGKVVRIISRGMSRIVGTYVSSRTYGFVEPDDARFNQDIFIPVERSMGAADGCKVVAELTGYGSDDSKNKKNPEGRIIEILGYTDEPGVDILSIAKGCGLPMEFPERVKNQALRVAKPVSDADMAGRMDLRGVQMVTIDGEDAKDLDDAVSLSLEGGYYRLGVHIADVSNYVQEHSALDVEALERGTSVYLPDRVIPMLPTELSNGICSLNAGEDRLALSCIMLIDKSGRIIGHEIAETVINVDARMTYTSVNNILALHDAAEIEKYAPLVPMFELMGELSAILREKRKSRGGIDFDFPETKVILDDKGHPVEIRPYERNVATDLIEDFMLAANETVAEDNFWQETPFVYRTHDDPDPEKIKRLAAFIAKFGYRLRASAGDVHPKELQKLLGKCIGTPEEPLISRLALRSMKQARYSTECSGHFGLAARYYCHFTSPIRRYPDLQVHRIIKDRLRGRMNDGRIAHYEEILPEVAKLSSERERRAAEAEREAVKLKKVQYMADHIGESYDGVISSVTGWGIYVELPNTVEGMVRLADMRDDYYIYDEEGFRLTGESSGKVYELGQAVRVRVVRADEVLRVVDFEMEE